MIEFLRFQNAIPKVVTKIDSASPVVRKTRPKRSWSNSQTKIRRRASSEDRFQVRKLEILEKARSQRTKWIRSEWENVVPKVMRRKRHCEKKNKSPFRDIENKSAIDIMNSLVNALSSSSSNNNNNTKNKDIEPLNEQHLEDLMNSSLNLLTSMTSSPPSVSSSKEGVKEEEEELPEEEAWFLELMKLDAAASIVASAQRFISTAIAEIQQRGDNNSNNMDTIGMIENYNYNNSSNKMGRVKSLGEISSAVLNLEDEEDDKKVAETKTEHVAEKIRKFTKYLQRRIYDVVSTSSGNSDKWSTERKNFVRSAIVEGCEKLLMTKLHDAVFGHLDSEPPPPNSECTFLFYITINTHHTY